MNIFDPIQRRETVLVESDIPFQHYLFGWSFLKFPKSQWQIDRRHVFFSFKNFDMPRATQIFGKK